MNECVIHCKLLSGAFFKGKWKIKGKVAHMKICQEGRGKSLAQFKIMYMYKLLEGKKVVKGRIAVDVAIRIPGNPREIWTSAENLYYFELLIQKFQSGKARITTRNTSQDFNSSPQCHWRRWWVDRWDVCVVSGTCTVCGCEVSTVCALSRRKRYQAECTSSPTNCVVRYGV